MKYKFMVNGEIFLGDKKIDLDNLPPWAREQREYLTSFYEESKKSGDISPKVGYSDEII